MIDPFFRLKLTTEVKYFYILHKFVGIYNRLEDSENTSWHMPDGGLSYRKSKGFKPFIVFFDDLGSDIDLFTYLLGLTTCFCWVIEQTMFSATIHKQL
ncbi:hypothetical protein AVEN_129493-1 [Araneus ventricosus]|uniref:Uncharacterized protein n=1 Tax=Araneus ventricosus TaxID=182803 RepID=A0A4Y1ZTJ8_ARAVE|nr:hypothetical protein AVEN_249453-1 [Araneus ventricosus]GBL67055.1 hypothetical protein AVEN_129493-1 [Araneus ventricosus]